MSEVILLIKSCLVKAYTRWDESLKINLRLKFFYMRFVTPNFEGDITCVRNLLKSLWEMRNLVRLSKKFLWKMENLVYTKYGSDLPLAQFNPAIRVVDCSRLAVYRGTYYGVCLLFHYKIDWHFSERAKRILLNMWDCETSGHVQRYNASTVPWKYQISSIYVCYGASISGVQWIWIQEIFSSLALFRSVWLQLKFIGCQIIGV